MRALNTVLLAVALAIVATVAFADDEPTKLPLAKKPRTLYQACRKELTRLCKGERYMMKCLLGNQTSVEEEVCKSWLAARAKCEKDVESCKDALRLCISKADVSSLSSECSESDFYKSIKRAASLRKKGLHGKEKVVSKEGATDSK